MTEPSQPLEPIEIHYYYATSWVINHHGLNQLSALADIAEKLSVGLRVRQMFADQYGYLIYPFAIQVPDEEVLHQFLEAVAAGVGMEEWYIVNVTYYEKGIPFVENYRKVLSQMPLWEQNMRQYAAHNAELYEKHQPTPPDEQGEQDE